jgi:RNA polymerase sigma-70 factor, ECF subfamily
MSIGWSARVTEKDDLSQLAPRLRRYACALSCAGEAAFADDLVATTLARLKGRRDHRGDISVAAFALLTQLHRDSQVERRARSAGAAFDAVAHLPASPVGPSLNKGLFCAFASLKLDEREALLLVAVEEFAYTQAMQILHVSRANLIARLARARARLTHALAGREQDVKTPHLRLVK